MTAPSPSPASHSAGLLAPSPSATSAFLQANSSPQTQSKLPIDFSPPLVAMVVVIAAAFFVVTYSRLISSYLIRFHRRWRRWRRRRRLFRSYVPSSGGDIESPPYNNRSSFDLSEAIHVLSPYGLEESVIKTIPLSVYTKKSSLHDCAVCLLEFEENDYVRTLPVCYHAFHVDCIDVWLRSHANCPLCRALIFRPHSPFVPLMAARIRPSFDEVLIESAILEPLEELPPQTEMTNGEIVQEINQSEDRFNGRDILLKRSYSFGFERNLGSERLTMEPATASPWRYRRSGGFWSKRTSPFTSLTKPRVFSFRYYRGMKSPFIRRRSGGFFPLSESSARYANGGSSRRSKSMASPMFMRSTGGSLFFSSSRLRTGDPEALLSPERYNNRR